MILGKLSTEMQNTATLKIDEVSTLEMLRMINEQDKLVPIAVEKELESITKTVDEIASRMEKGGRLFYVGAGTSGRLGVLDASECPPTFSVSKDLVVGVMAGGSAAYANAKENIEDIKEAGRTELGLYNISKLDSVVAIAASGRTPYCIGALELAGEVGAFTSVICCNKNSEMSKFSEVAIEVVTGPEVLTGSTRLKAGTAQKLVLNMLSTGVMIKLGKSYGNLMIGVSAANVKLVDRAIRITMAAAQVDYEIAKSTLEKCEYSSKCAVVMIKKNCDKKLATELLKKANGKIKVALSM